MTNKTKAIISVICASFLLTFCPALTVSATTVGDVIAYAYQIGMPEEMIQEYIALGSGREWTSAQCDKAIGMLSAWAAERDAAISSGGQSQQSTEPLEPEEFEKLTVDEKKEYITSIGDDQKQEYLDIMSNDEKNQLLKELDPAEQAEIVSGMLGFGDSFGINFSIEDISDGSVMISARDDENKLIGLTVLGDSVEKTGITYPVPILCACGLIVLSAAGIAVFVQKGGCGS